MSKQEEIRIWLCWCYGKVMKWLVIYPLWRFWHYVRRIELKIYWHTRRVRRHWDSYMFKKELGGL